MQRSQCESSARRWWLRSARLLWAALVLSGSCGDETAEAASVGSPPTEPQGDSGQAALDAATRSAARSRSYASASATLVAVADDAADGGSTAVAGHADFRGTTEGVDLQIELQTCTGEAAYLLAILEASDCSIASLQAAEWQQGRAQDLPVLACPGTGVGQAATGYSRPSAKEGAWTVGDGSASDVVGRVLVVRGAHETAPAACGVIRRGEDVQRLELPPDDQAPSIAARAAVGGICYGRQYPGSTPRCPDDAALLRCEATHCDIGTCLQTCDAYASCLDRQGTQCSFTSGCEPSAACAKCQDEIQRCSQTFCAEHAWCAATPSPDGPCQRVASCCALQGPEAQFCLGTLVPVLSGLGGDSSCIGNMIDLGFTPLLHVPCTFGPVQVPTGSGESMDTTSTDPGIPLADHHAGIACASDEDCPGGLCAPASQAAAADGGMASRYCTRPCEATHECGRDGTCSGVDGAKQCFAACRDQRDCREGFLCSGGAQGALLSLPGSCRPKRQPDQLADGVAGRACANDTQCGGGHCATQNLLGTSYPGNYCTARCYEDTHCGKGGVCLWTPGSSDPGYCLQQCNGDADCPREDYGCWELSDGTRALHACYPRMRPLPDHRTGSACTSDEDCGAPHAYCAKTLPYYGALTTNETREAPEGYCTQRCALDVECGAGAQCINQGTLGGLCFATCTTNKPCRDGYTCYAHGRDNDLTASVCLGAMP